MSTFFETTESAIETRFRDEVAVPQGLFTHYTNGPPEPVAKDRDAKARVTLLWASREPVQNGGNAIQHRAVGTLIVQLFVKTGTGKQRMHALKDAVTNAFRAVRVGDVLFFSPYPVRVGTAADDPAWYQENVVCEFWADETV